MKPFSIFCVLALLTVTPVLFAGPRDKQWDKVTAASRKGLPKTAIEELKPIIADALADKAYPEAIKAIAQKIALEGQIEGNKPEEQIGRMQAELAKAPAAMKPMMEAILAHWYWSYFQRNRWKFLQRTQTAAGSGPDLQTWDLARILTEIDRHFTAALANEKLLKKTPIADYDDLLEYGEVPDAYRPTLYDFIANDALKSYQAGEHAAVKAEDNFEVDASSPIFGDVSEFEHWQPTTTDDTSPIPRAIALYQSLLSFHHSDRNRSAFYDADLARLAYGHNITVGENKDDRYKAALRRFIDVTAKHEISSRALAALATLIKRDGDLVKARELAERGLKAFPNSKGAAMCFNLIQQIETKSAGLATESVWNAPWPTLDVTYRNVTKVYFRAVAVDFEDQLARSRWGFGNLDQAQRDALLAAKPALEWSADLPPTPDYKERTEKLAAPTSLKPGYYFIVASHDSSFGTENNQIAFAAVWVSELAMSVQEHYDGKPNTGFVLEANSGLPVADATVRIWQRDNQGQYKSRPTTKTDENGRFQFPIASNQGYVLLAEHNGQAVASSHELYSYRRENSLRSKSQTVFFTDRALYRPGQTISYKGICIDTDQDKGSYQTLGDQEVEVSFRDPNGKEIARATHRTNDYGSFSGTFTAPRDRLMGQMSLQVDNGGPAGRANFSVEEYKRPKFQVELNAPGEAAKLNAPITIVGKATAYTGAAIGGATVKWRVERNVRLPLWCWWWRPPAMKAIAHGTALTESDGTFTIQFNAEPDRTVPEKNEPVFGYTVHADVTDATGETRSDSRTVRAGYTALQATLSTKIWQTPDKPVELDVQTTSLDGDPVSAAGTITIRALKQPATVIRAPMQSVQYRWPVETDEPMIDPSNPDSWDLAEVITQKNFTTDATGKVTTSASLKAGIYRVSLETKDRFGKPVTARLTLEVVDPNSAHYLVKLPNHLASPAWSLEPGQKFTALWGTGYETGRAFVEIECAGKTLESYWTKSDRTQESIELPITEEMRGGVMLRVTYVRENRAYLNQHVIDVPWSNKQLDVKWEHFRSRLLPGQKETWTAVVTGHGAKRAAAEMVATLYDASLDQFKPHNWPTEFGVFRSENSFVSTTFQNAETAFQPIDSWKPAPFRNASLHYRQFPADILFNTQRSAGVLLLRGASADIVELSPFEVSTSEDPEGYQATSTLAGTRIGMELFDIAGSASSRLSKPGPNGEATPPRADLNTVTARKNLNETAFFFPQLLSDENGVVKMVFTMPEALTQWKFMGFTHDKELRSGFLTDKVVTAKDLMVEPNPPRFVREGDAIEFTVKVSNQTQHPQTGSVRLTFADAVSLKPEDKALGNIATEKLFDIPAKQSRSFSWRITVPDGMGFLTYKAVGATADLSDGEEGFLPVLSRRILVTESLPLPIRGKTTKEFEFKKLLDSGKSTTLKNESLTVQMVSQPAWYAVMALPYLMEYPYECSEQVFNRYYANELARHIASSDPKIRRIFDLWKNTPALESPLEKNQDLKSVMLEETPWVQQANSETQARKNVGLLFDQNRLDAGSAHALQQLADRQLGDGLWSWFPGGHSSEYISLYITTGFGRLRHLGVDVDLAPALKSLDGLDDWLDRNYRSIQQYKHPEEYVPTYTVALYLYGRSFFLKERPVADGHREALDFFLRQARKYWLSVNSRQCQAQLALALQRFGDLATPQDIMKSLKERCVTNVEMGMYWRDPGSSWWWYEAPIETQAVMIEAFDEVAHDAQAVEDCKVWLLKQKQTQDWRTTKATADAIYGLLLHGDNLLASDALVKVTLGGKMVEPAKTEAGTGFYEQKFIRDEIKPAMGRITVTKPEDGISWGSVHWQYLEDMSKVTPHEGTPLKLKKNLFTKETTKKGQTLKPVNGPLAVGDELVVRIELQADRDMEYVHLKDERGSGTEPVNVLSRYKFQDGLAYYETTRDTASHFFIDYLPKGTYVFEYSTRIQLKGTYQTGIAEIQCMYAPEFNSHSESFTLEVK